ncbi:MAG: protein phosphatase [Planctomycetota bacterium]
MLELIPKRTWIANAIEIRDARKLFDAGIEAVVDVAYEEPPASLPRQLIHCRYPLNDGGGNSAASIRAAVLGAAELMRNNLATIIACSAGKSRSPIVTAFALAALDGESPQTVLERIATQRPLQLNPLLWNDVVAALN